jgi:DNA anti-recombination protein RmuC
VTAIDTHGIVKRLKEAGFSEAQAEAVTDVVREVRESDIAHLATKADLLITKTELQTSISEIRAELQELRTELQTSVAGIRAELQTSVAGIRAELQTSIAQIRAEMAEQKSDLLRYIVTISLGTGALVVALIKLIPGGY